MLIGRFCAAVGGSAILAVVSIITLSASGIAVSLGWRLGIAVVVGVDLGLAL